MKKYFHKVNFILFWTFTLLGAIIEHIAYYLSSKKKTLSNPILTGFPLYGFCGLLVIYLDNYTILHQQSGIIKFITFSIILSTIEYITGILVNAGKNSNKNNIINSWNYSNNFMNIDGKIDLLHTIFFGLCGYLIAQYYPTMYKYIHRIFI